MRTLDPGTRHRGRDFRASLLSRGTVHHVPHTQPPCRTHTERVPTTPNGDRGTFCALDVETANPDPASICQIGVATAKDGRIAEVWTRLIRPSSPFAPSHIRIHGITADLVACAPPFSKTYPDLEQRLLPIVVTHTRFDIAAMLHACRSDRLSMFERTWLDSSLLPRLAWPHRFGNAPRSLHWISTELGISFRAHDAGEDARAAAEITLRCVQAARVSIESWARDFGIHTRKSKRRGPLTIQT